MDSLEDEEAPPRRGTRPRLPASHQEDFESEFPTARQDPRVEYGEIDFAREGVRSAPPSSRYMTPALPADLPSLNVAPAPSTMPIDAATAAEYAQHSRHGEFERHEEIEAELGVDLSLRGSPDPAQRVERRRNYTPTPGRVSVRPSRPSSPGQRQETGRQPYPLAPSALAPEVAPVEPPSPESQAPPAESMSEPEQDAPEAPEQDIELTGEVLGDRVHSPSPPPSPADDPDDDDDILADAFQRLQSLPPQVAPASPPSDAPEPTPPSVPEGGAARTHVDGIDLMDVPGLQDLPEDAQADLVARARIITLGPGEEVSSFGVALVTAGSVQLMPTIADAACAHARKGDVLFTTGTMKSDVVLRVVGAEPNSRVAVFGEADLAAATADCPWVADELAEVGDRYNAFGGAVLGPLGESLDEMFRSMVLGKCSVKHLAAGSLVVEGGKSMDGMYVLGVGALEILAPGGGVDRVLGPGDFVFPETLLSASPARATVRVAEEGALVLYADRMGAHELLATCPPFIELLAGG